MTSLSDILERRLLTPLFQPVVDIGQRSIYGHESLIRGPADSPLHEPDALFGEARRHGLHPQLELACSQAGANRFSAGACTGSLFVNVSASALLHYWAQWGHSLPERLLQHCDIAPDRLVLELTEQDSIPGALPILLEAFRRLRREGVRVALDDYGVGHSSLQLWAEVEPDLVKVDRYFFADISRDERKQKMVRAIANVAQCFGTPLVAEGIESAADLSVAQGLGIRYAQGWLFGRPSSEPLASLPEGLRRSLDAQLPQLSLGSRLGTAASLRVQAPTVSRDSHTNDDVHRLFMEHLDLHAVAVVDPLQRPVGIINRRDFSERYAQRYTRELFGRHPCTTFMNPAPVLVDQDTSIDQLSHVLISEDQRYLVDGFIITADGRYDGLGTGEALVRSVTEMRIEAARYANPLTSLPGNIPISQHIVALIEAGEPFVTCYCDLNNFKPFNDVYGYWRGDDMIRLCADIIRRHSDPQRDFVGHVGGDDFVMLQRSPDWRARIESIISEFNRRAIDLYDDHGRAQGGIEAEDRYGVVRFFPFVSLGIGALCVDPAQHQRLRPEDIASGAAQVKHKVKHGNLGLVVEDYVQPQRQMV